MFSFIIGLLVGAYGMHLYYSYSVINNDEDDE